jgi:Kelch motif
MSRKLTSYAIPLLWALLACDSGGFDSHRVQVPTKLVFIVQPTASIVGVAMRPSVVVAVQDVRGNLVTSASTSVTVAIANNPASGRLLGTATVPVVNGVAIFSDLSLEKTGTGYTLIADAVGLNRTSSSPFNVTLAPAKLAFEVQPSSTPVARTIAPPLQVAVVDAEGNTVESASTSVTLGIGTNPVGGTLIGSTAALAVNGIATFSNLSIDRVGAGYTLTASASGVNGATSAAFTITSFAGTHDPVSVHSFDPGEVQAGTDALTLTLTGENFLPVLGFTWSATGRTTVLYPTAEGSTRLTVVLPAELLRVPTLAWISLWDFSGNQLWSGNFAVRPPAPTGETPFRPTGAMNRPRGGHRAVLLEDGRVLIVGGEQRTAELYDPATERFELTGTMGTPRLWPSATLLVNGKVLVAGGLGGRGAGGALQLLDSAEIFDPLSGTFTPTGSMAVAHFEHTATLLKDGKVLVTGGNDFPAIASAEIFDPQTGSFTRADDMTTARTEHTATLLRSGHVLIAGGWNGHAPDALDDPPWDPEEVELFDPATARFSPSAAMSATRYGHQALQLSDGRVLLLGGIPQVQNLHHETPHPDYAEIFDPATGQFSAGPDGLGTVQSRYTATMLLDGGVLLAGGVESTPVNSAAVLDLGQGRLSPIPGLSVARREHTATRLVDGRVLLTGGYDERWNPLDSAELYR